jgi:hypothetical protein
MEPTGVEQHRRSPKGDLSGESESIEAKARTFLMCHRLAESWKPFPAGMEPMGIERHRRRSPRRLSEGESANGASGKRCDIDAAKWRSQIETWEVRVNQPKSKREHVPESPNTHVIYRTTRAANRKALKPQPTRQAKLVAWHPTFRALNRLASAFGMSLDTW